MQKEKSLHRSELVFYAIYFSKVVSYPSGRAYVVLLLKLLELPFLGFVLLRKASNDLANLMREKFYN
jgi:hypothetical protein